MMVGAFDYYQRRFLLLVRLHMLAIDAEDIALARKCLQAERECVFAELLIMVEANK